MRVGQLAGTDGDLEVVLPGWDGAAEGGRVVAQGVSGSIEVEHEMLGPRLIDVQKAARAIGFTTGSGVPEGDEQTLRAFTGELALEGRQLLVLAVQSKTTSM